MKKLQTYILAAIGAALLWTLTACDLSKTTVCPLPPDGGEETTPFESVDVSAYAGTPYTTEQPPHIGIQYRDEGATCHAALTMSETYDWTVYYTDGTTRQMHSEGVRPCETAGLSEVWSADPEGTVHILVGDYDAADDVPNTDITVSVYPVREDGTIDLSEQSKQTLSLGHAQSFTMLMGHHYYELSVTYKPGTAVHGFIGYRTDVYEVTETQYGCCVEIYEEDPDVAAKRIPNMTLSRPYSENSRLGRMLSPCGFLQWTYTNHKSTVISSHKFEGEPTEQLGMQIFETDELSYEYDIEIDGSPDIVVEKITVTRYAVDSKLPDKTIEITDGKITLQGSSYYVFDVQFENGSAQYVLKTKVKLPDPSHMQDDKTIDPALAQKLREEFTQWRVEVEGAQRELIVENIWVQKYFGNVNGCEIVYMGGPWDYTAAMRPVTVAGYVITFGSGQKLYVYRNGSFHTLSEAYELGLLTKQNIYDIGAAVDGSFTGHFPTP